jgi:hypothetical protein
VRNADGIVVRLRAGHMYRSDDPIVLLHPDLFEPVEIPTVEQATRNPGQKRTTRRPAK